MHHHVRMSRKAAGIAASILIMGLIQLAGAPSADAAASADVTVAPVTAAIGSGTVVQQIAIPASSALAGQSTPLVIMPDSGIATNGFTAAVDANGESGASCSQDSGDSGFTCAAPPAGWNAGGYLDLDFGAGGASTAAPPCGATCTFTTEVYENDTTDTPATGTVTVDAEATLTLSLSGVTGGALTMSVSNSGPTETTDLSVDITGQGGYSISSSSAQCSKVGTGYVCDAGDTSGAVNTSDSWTVQFSGATGPIAITATAYATVYPGGTADTLNGNAPAQLNWTPITTPVPVATTTGPVVGPTPSPTVTVKATATAKATAKGSSTKVAPGVPKTATAPKATASATATAEASSTAGALTAVSASASPAAGVEAGGQSGTKASGGGGGVSVLLLILLGVLLLAIIALGTWFARRAPSRRRHEKGPAADPDLAPVAARSESAPVAPVPAARAREYRGYAEYTRTSAAPGASSAVTSLAPGTSGIEHDPEPEPVPPFLARTRAAIAPPPSTWFPVAAAGPVPDPAPGPELERHEVAREPVQAAPAAADAFAPRAVARGNQAGAGTQEGAGTGAGTAEEPGDRPFDPMNDTGPIKLDDFFRRPPGM